MDKETAESNARHIRQVMCKNGTVALVNINKEGEAELYDLSFGGCEKDRRSGSAYCQECSDKHYESTR